MNAADSARLACWYLDDRPVDEKADDYSVNHAREFLKWGFPLADLADWMIAHGPPNKKRLHLELGYTPEQYECVEYVYDERMDEDHESDVWDDRSHVTAWEELLRTVPPHFLSLCVRAGALTDHEIREWDRKRRNGDPDIVSQLTMQAALLNRP